MDNSTLHAPEASHQFVHAFHEEMEWLSRVIEGRIRNSQDPVADIEYPPSLEPEDPYSQFVIKEGLDPERRLIVALSFIPHVRPDFFDSIIQKNLSNAGDFPQMGGVRGQNFRGFLPTGETALYLIAGEDLYKKCEVQELFTPDDYFARKQVLWVDNPPAGDPAMSGKLVLSPELVEFFTLGRVTPPRFGLQFPAIRVETGMEWDDLVLPHSTMHSIRDLENWIKYGHTLLHDWGMAKKIKPGYRVLFHGPPGTGKTLTASLLGKYTQRDVYKIDLSLVVSKFIGETEKNLANLFDKAENKGWILFFDEADALFGKRTNVRDAHDKYANQEVSFLLQRTETYAGMVILATNFKSNIDEAFARRFQSHIYFPAPKYDERMQLWSQAFPPQVTLGKDLDLSQIARQYELTGANIMNVVQYACLSALSEQKKVISAAKVLEGIQGEFAKEGKLG